MPDDTFGHTDGRSALSHVTASSRARQIAQSKQHIALVASIAAVGLAAALSVVLLIHNRAEKPAIAKPTTVVEPTHLPSPVASATTLRVETRTVNVSRLYRWRPGCPTAKRPQSGVPSAFHSLGPPPASVSKPSKPDCTSPFVVDDKGRKHYKAACL